MGKEQEVRVQRSLEPGEADDVSLLPPAEPAGGQGITHVTRGAGADGAVVPGLALGVLTTGILTWRPAVEIKTGAVQGTLAVIDALAWKLTIDRNLLYIIVVSLSPLEHLMSGSPLYPGGQVHTGRSEPDLSNPAWHWAPGPQGLGVHRSFFSKGRQLTKGSPV